MANWLEIEDIYSPPYATSRLLLDEKREPLHKIKTGQRKGTQNQQLTLVDGDADEVAAIKRIFHEFVALGYSEHRIIGQFVHWIRPLAPIAPVIA
jgi:hypothetical protein